MTYAGRDLTRAEFDKVGEFLKALPAFKCPIDAHIGFSVGHHFAEPAPQYPMVLLICQKCGHVVQFSAVTLGLVPMKSAGNPWRAE